MPGSSAHVILQAEYLTGLPCPTSWDVPDPGIKPAFATSPALAGGLFFLPLAPPGKTNITHESERGSVVSDSL